MNNYQDEEYKEEEKLPFYEQMLRDLEDEALVWRISWELGGQKFYIPSKVTQRHLEKHFFAKRYGEKFFCWIVKHYHDRDLIIPMGMSSVYKRNKTQAEILASRGFSRNEIARQLGIHYTSAQRAKRRIKNQNQPDLF